MEKPNTKRTGEQAQGGEEKYEKLLLLPSPPAKRNGTPMEEATASVWRTAEEPDRRRKVFTHAKRGEGNYTFLFVHPWISCPRPTSTYMRPRSLPAAYNAAPGRVWFLSLFCCSTFRILCPPGSCTSGPAPLSIFHNSEFPKMERMRCWPAMKLAVAVQPVFRSLLFWYHCNHATNQKKKPEIVTCTEPKTIDPKTNA